MKVYTLTHDQLFHLWHKAHSRGVDICLLNLGIDTKVEDDIFREYVAALSPEPSADVVERIAEDLIQSGIRDDDSDMWCAKVAFFVAPIIEAEVGRRVRERTKALEQIRDQDPVENCLDPQWASRIAKEALE